MTVSAAGPSTDDERAADDAGLDLAIVGVACRAPGAADVAGYWHNLREGVESIRTCTRGELLAEGVPPAVIDDPAFVPACGALARELVEGFDAEFFGFTAREAELLDPQHRLFLECSWEALESAGYDPARFPGRIGVFGGAGMSLYAGPEMLTYFRRHVQPHADLLATLEGPQVIIANGLDYLCTRVSYKLDLRGPSVDVQTACSTSLVAVHMACQAVLAGECDMALAGGAAVHLPLRTGYRYQDGGLFSPDGHCRPYDADARGTVGGSGVGVVVVKRLAQALADRDQIFAVVKGSAVNNDGSAKVSYMAPSVNGQADVVEAALAVAGVAADTVGFVEGHGTGTRLGDPIEVAALTQAYRRTTARRGYCALGSVKGNIGHLDTAAGVLGLIKAVLAVKHGELPPTLHFSRPNPELDLDVSPFYVSAERRPWPAASHPRRAGVSALGAGGTNVHVILEEPPPRPRPDPARRVRPLHLLTLSGRSEAAVRALADALAGRLAASDALDLDDVCFTANVGRARFRWRAAVVGPDREALRRELAAVAAGAGAVLPRRADAPSGRPAGLAFLCTGQGAQQVGMGAPLLTTLPVFRAAFERCAAVFRAQTGRSLRALVLGEAPGLDETGATQPALFALEYALACTWRAWGVTPTAVLGHSLGEYVAACVAGVFEPEEAMRLVIARARLMQALPAGGAMATVDAAESWVAERIADERDRVAVAGLNGPEMTVLSGDAAAVERLTARFAAEGVPSRPLRVSHAFHSPRMDPMLDAFAEVAAQVTFRAPTIPLISNLRGEVAGPEIATAAYWVRHVREPVRFAEGMRALWQLGVRRFVELGPRPTLIGLGRACVPDEDALWTASLRPEASWQQLLTAAGELHRDGVELDWHAFHADAGPARVDLPTYPFQRKRAWLDPPAPRPAADLAALQHPDALCERLLARGFAEAERGLVRRVLAALRDELADELATAADPLDWLYGVTWSRDAGPTRAAALAGRRWLIVCAAADAGVTAADRVTQALRRSGAECTVVLAGAGTAARGDLVALDASEPAACERALGACVGAGRYTDLLVLAEDVARGEPPATATRWLCALTHAAVRVLADGGLRSCRLVTRGAQQVDAADPIDPAGHALWGLARALRLEQRELEVRCLDLDPDEGARAGLPVEAIVGDAPPELARRGDMWLVSHVTAHPGAPRDCATRPVRGDATYLITGGLGELGLALAGHLVERGARDLVLLGRGSPSAAHQARLSALRASGAAVTTAQVHVADRAALGRVFAELQARGAAVAGVVHAAGVVEDGVLVGQAWPAFERVLAAKVDGAWNLHELTRERPLDFFVLFSSVAGTLGSPGQANYAAANAFLDGLARLRRRAGLPAQSVAWGPWAEIGMAARTVAGNHRRGGHRVAELAPAAGLAVFDRLPAACTACVVLPLAVAQRRDAEASDLAGFARALWGLDERPAAPGAGKPPGVGAPDPLVERWPALVPAARHDALRALLEATVADMLGSPAGPAAGPDATFYELGIDSMAGLQMRTLLTRALGLTLPATLLFRHPTLAALTERLAAMLDERDPLVAGRDVPPAPRAPAHAPTPNALSADAIAALLAEELER